MAAAILVAGLLIAGAGTMGYSAARQNDPVLATAPQKQASQPPATAPAAAPPIARDSPRAGGAAPAKNQFPLVIQADMVDSQGHGLPGVDVIVTIYYPRPLEEPEKVPDRAVSDHNGRIRVEFARERVAGRLSGAIIWAYQPGRALARSSYTLEGTTSPPVIRLTLEQPVKRTIVVVGPDDRPIAGLRLSPRSLRRGNSRVAAPSPDELLERLTVTTDAKGEAIIPYLAPGMEPLTVQVAGPGIAAHTLALIDSPQKTTLKIGRTGRLAGIVHGESGQPIAGVSVVVWARTSDIRASSLHDRNSPPEVIRFEKQPFFTGAHGAFQTPPTLLDGSTYRVSIRHDGFAPFVSEWVTLGGERTAIPGIRLQALRKLAGQVYDRQGRPVGAARVSLPSRGPSTMTDAQGRFELRDILPDKTFVLVQQAGFRFQGWPVDPVMQAGELRLTLVRASEAPDRNMTALAEPISPDDARALAYRVLKPYFQDGPEQVNLSAKTAALKALSMFDLNRALELFQEGGLRNVRSPNYLRTELALKLAEKDPVEAKAFIEPISDPVLRVQGLLTLAKAIPASKGEQKRQLLEEVVPLVRGTPNPTVKITQIAAIAEAYLDLGEVEKARPLLQEGLKLFDTLPYSPASGASCPSYCGSSASRPWRASGRSPRQSASCLSRTSPPNLRSTIRRRPSGSSMARVS